ncbi:MAG TPA: phytanoyl-CoA dioxygenase family protein [Candidatus Lustribacter sp.]|jgi:hypothetical protein|nr:phytanoyl-CoA dioxygenase family protein [Candidatus Lustribacter sp.]
MSCKQPIFDDAELERAFQRDGYVTVPLLDAAELSELAESWRTISDPVQQQAFSATMFSTDAAYRRRTSRAICERIVPHVHRLMPNVRLVIGSFVTKLPGDGGYLGMHQDPSFVDDAYYTSANVWFPLVDLTESNGALWVVPGSHVLDPEPRAFLARFPHQEFESVLRGQYARPLYVPAGTAVIAHHGLYHFSPPNHSGAIRIACAALVVSADAPLRFFHEVRGEGRIDVYAVGDDFYCSYVIGTAPDAVHVDTIPLRANPLELQKLKGAPPR